MILFKIAHNNLLAVNAKEKERRHAGRQKDRKCQNIKLGKGTPSEKPFLVYSTTQTGSSPAQQNASLSSFLPHRTQDWGVRSAIAKHLLCPL